MARRQFEVPENFAPGLMLSHRGGTPRSARRFLDLRCQGFIDVEPYQAEPLGGALITRGLAAKQHGELVLTLASRSPGLWSRGPRNGKTQECLGFSDREEGVEP